MLSKRTEQSDLPIVSIPAVLQQDSQMQKKKSGISCSPLTGVTTNSGDPPTGYRVYDACRGSSVFRGCRLSMS